MGLLGTSFPLSKVRIEHSTSSYYIGPGYGSLNGGGAAAMILPAALLLRCCAFDEVAGLDTERRA